jgi:hypothetical protein
VVDLVEVDVVDAEPAQRTLDRFDQPAARAAAPVGAAVAHRAVALGGEHDVVAPAAQRLADDPLGLTVTAVDVGGVDDVDPAVERATDDADALVGIGVAHRAEHHGAQAVGGDVDSGAAEGAGSHSGCPSCSSACGFVIRRRRRSRRRRGSR